PSASIVLCPRALHDALPISPACRSAAEGRVCLVIPANRRNAGHDSGSRQQRIAKSKTDVEGNGSSIRTVVSDGQRTGPGFARQIDRKSTRLNSSHVKISYAV